MRAHIIHATGRAHARAVFPMPRRFAALASRSPPGVLRGEASRRVIWGGVGRVEGRARRRKCAVERPVTPEPRTRSRMGVVRVLVELSGIGEWRGLDVCRLLKHL